MFYARLSLILILSFSSSAYSLSCQQVRQLAAVYLKLHYSYNEFGDSLSERTLDQFIKSWDPGKLYFYKSDVEGFKKKYSKTLDDQILAANCKPVTDVINVFGKRFEERHQKVKKLIDAKHNFKMDEYLELDRKKMVYAKTSEEIEERWRKRIKFQLLQLKTTLKSLKKAREKLHKRYSLAVKRHNDQTINKVYARFLNAFSSSLDPHTTYMSADALEDFRISTRLSLEGIGAVLRTEDGFTVIQSLVPGGAAYKSGLVKVEDKIIAVAQAKGEPVDVIDMDLRDVVKLIRGTGGTTVKLTIAREEGGKTIQLVAPIVREKIQLTDRTAKSKAFKAQVIDKNKKKVNLKIGVLDLPSFYVDFEGLHNKVKDYRSSVRDTIKEIESLRRQNVDAIVLDLRSNGGGSLTESVQIAGLFFDKGPVVQIKESDGSMYSHSDKDGKTYYDGPLVLMISRQSASASEILAGAIKDFGRGLIVGDDHTFGKGTVQNLNEIGERLGAYKVTIQQFYLPSGASTQLRGVDSDVILPSVLGEIDIGEKFYDYALKWDKIKKSKYKNFNLVKPYAKTLAANSKKRVAKDAEFKKIFENIKEFKKNQQERTRVSLKEETPKEKKKKELAKKEKEKEKKKDDDSQEIILEDDPHLQETIRIAADYVLLLDKKKPMSVALPELKVKPKKQVAEKKPKKLKKQVASEAKTKDPTSKKTN